MTQQDRDHIATCLQCTASPPECDNQHARGTRCEFIRRYGKLMQRTAVLKQDSAGVRMSQ
jgi:hypothetical protein